MIIRFDDQTPEYLKKFAEPDAWKAFDLDAGIYHKALVQEETSMQEWLEQYMVEKGIFPEPSPFHGLDGVAVMELKKQMRDTPGLAEYPTALEVILKHFGITYQGTRTDTIKKFVQTPHVEVLFPAVMSTTIFASMIRASKYKDFVASSQVMSGSKYTRVYLESITNEGSLGRRGRSAPFPQIRVKLDDKDAYMWNAGVDLRFSYKHIYDTPFAQFKTMVLDRIGKRLGMDKWVSLVDVLHSGDGAVDGLSATYTHDCATPGTIVKKDIISFSAVLDETYQLDRFVGAKAKLIDYYEVLTGMTSPQAQWAQMAWKLPMGYVTPGTTASGVDDVFVGVDSTGAINESMGAQAVLEESDKIIGLQEVQTVVSTAYGFNIIDRNAIGGMDID